MEHRAVIVVQQCQRTLNHTRRLRSVSSAGLSIAGSCERSETDHHADSIGHKVPRTVGGWCEGGRGSDASAKVPLLPAQAEIPEAGMCEDSRGPAAVRSRQPDATVAAAKKTGMTRRVAHLRRRLGLVGDRGAVGRLAISADAELAQVSEPNH